MSDIQIYTDFYSFPSKNVLDQQRKAIKSKVERGGILKTKQLASVLLQTHWIRYHLPILDGNLSERLDTVKLWLLRESPLTFCMNGFWEKSLWHSNSFLPVCILSCWERCSTREKAFLRSVRSGGFSPVWALSWWRSCDLLGKILLGPYFHLAAFLCEFSGAELILTCSRKRRYSSYICTIFQIIHKMSHFCCAVISVKVFSQVLCS